MKMFVSWNVIRVMIVVLFMKKQVYVNGNTPMKLRRFKKMVDYNKYQHVTYNQIDMMKHTIGFDDRKVKGTKHRKYEPYRNYYNAGERDKAELDKLVEIGFMKKSSEDYYHVTDDGKTFIYYVTGVQILPDMK